MARKQALTPAYRWAIASRALAAAVGGFACASAAAIALAAALDVGSAMARATAVHLATLLAFALWAFLAMYVFKVRTVARAWSAIAIPTVALGTVAWWLLRN